jgi:hypothetical protein
MEQTTIVWFSLSTAIVGGLLIFAAGFLLGLCCGVRPFISRTDFRDQDDALTPRS